MGRCSASSALWRARAACWRPQAEAEAARGPCYGHGRPRGPRPALRRLRGHLWRGGDGSRPRGPTSPDPAWAGGRRGRGAAPAVSRKPQASQGRRRDALPEVGKATRTPAPPADGELPARALRVDGADLPRAGRASAGHAPPRPWGIEDDLRLKGVASWAAAASDVHDLEQGHRPGGGGTRVSKGLPDLYFRGHGVRAWFETKRWDNVQTPEQVT